MRGSAMNRLFGLLSQWGLRLSLRRLREPDAMALLEQRGVPEDASEIGDVARFGSPRTLIGYAGLAPKIHQSGDRSRTGSLSKAGSRTLRWAAVEAAQHAWRASNPWHQIYTDLAARAGKNPAKSAVARKVLIAAWHVLSRQQPFTPPQPRRPNSASASSRCFLAA
jgi:transposase